MEKPKSEHGGPRPGAGRKPINDAPMAINLVVRVTPELRDKIKQNIPCIVLINVYN